MSTSDPLPSLALLAGGLATRMHPITATIPKSLIEIEGEPFIAHQLRLLSRESVADIVICVGYLGEQIEAYVGDGHRFGCNVRYSYDGDFLLGTGGALRKSLPLLGDQFFVMYGDSYLEIRFRAVYDAFKEAKRPALMTVHRNAGRWDTSNIEFANGVLLKHDKKNRTPTMQYIDYGLSVCTASVLAEQPENKAFDLADLYGNLVDRNLVAGYEVRERFYEIGSPAGLAETSAFLKARQSVSL
jgi:NDP-sugar pyrophosphorylase family protein